MLKSIKVRGFWTLFVVVAALAACGAAGKFFFLSSTETEAAQAAAPEPQPAPVVKVAREDLSSSITLSAEFRPYLEADLHAKIAGYLDQINVDIGDQVREGQVLAKLDPAELAADRDQAQAAFDDAKLEYDRISGVARKQPGLVAQQDVDKAKAKYDMAKASLERATTFVDYATITAPFDGIITKRYVDPGALVQASTNSSTQTLPVVRLAKNTKLRLDFPVPEYVVPKIHPGTRVEVAVQATKQAFDARVARITGNVDQSTRTMEAEVDVENKDLRLVPGMYAAVTIELDHKAGALALPVQAVSMGDHPTVLIVNAKNEIEERPVKTGLQTANEVEILNGVAENDLVVFGNRSAFSQGMKIVPKLSEPPSPKPEAQSDSSSSAG